ncbi:MAG: RNA polymerase sigma factor [Solirubrobacteraceae bacterium]|nr:RNA polymerase sigma factor [Patulibacter sp.]
MSVAELFERHAAAVRARIARRDPGLADDVVSETFAVAVRRAATIPEGAERAWLFVVADNVLRNQQRGRRRAAAIADALAPHAATSSPAPEIPVVGDALAGLPDRERALLTMTALEGLSTGEAAQRLGIATGTAMNAMVTGRRRLSARLAALGVVVSTVVFGFVFAAAAQAGARRTAQPPATLAQSGPAGPPAGHSRISALTIAGDSIGSPWVPGSTASRPSGSASATAAPCSGRTSSRSPWSTRVGAVIDARSSIERCGSARTMPTVSA